LFLSCTKSAHESLESLYLKHGQKPREKLTLLVDML
jgi:hypothetical protein